MDVASVWGAHAPRVPVLAPRQNELSAARSRHRGQKFAPAGRHRQHARARALPRKAPRSTGDTRSRLK